MPESATPSARPATPSNANPAPLDTPTQDDRTRRVSSPLRSASVIHSTSFVGTGVDTPTLASGPGRESVLTTASGATDHGCRVTIESKIAAGLNSSARVRPLIPIKLPNFRKVKHASAASPSLAGQGEGSSTAQLAFKVPIPIITHIQGPVQEHAKKSHHHVPSSSRAATVQNSSLASKHGKGTTVPVSARTENSRSAPTDVDVDGKARYAKSKARIATLAIGEWRAGISVGATPRRVLPSTKAVKIADSKLVDGATTSAAVLVPPKDTLPARLLVSNKQISLSTASREPKAPVASSSKPKELRSQANTSKSVPPIASAVPRAEKGRNPGVKGLTAVRQGPRTSSPSGQVKPQTPQYRPSNAEIPQCFIQTDKKKTAMASRVKSTTSYQSCRRPAPNASPSSKTGKKSVTEDPQPKKEDSQKPKKVVMAALPSEEDIAKLEINDVDPVVFELIGKAQKNKVILKDLGFKKTKPSLEDDGGQSPKEGDDASAISKDPTPNANDANSDQPTAFGQTATVEKVKPSTTSPDIPTVGDCGTTSSELSATSSGSPRTGTQNKRKADAGETYPVENRDHVRDDAPDSDLPGRPSKRHRVEVEQNPHPRPGALFKRPFSRFFSRSPSVASSVTLVGHDGTPTPEPDSIELRKGSPKRELELLPGDKPV